MSRTVRLQLLLSCEDLPRINVMRKPPNAVCFVAIVTDSGSVMGSQRHRIGVTEIVPQSSCPEFTKVIILNHRLGTETKIAIDIFHCKNVEEEPQWELNNFVHRGLPQSKGIDSLGSSVLDVEAIMSRPDYCLTDTLGKGGKLHVRVEVSNETMQPGSFRFQFRALELPNVRRNFMDRPNFYLEINRKQKGISQDIWHPVYRTKMTSLTLQPFWELDSLDLEVLCNHEIHRELRLMIMDLDGSSRKQVGWVDTTPDSLIDHKATHGNADDSKAYFLTKGMEGQVINNRLGKLIVLEAELLYQRGGSMSDAYCMPIPEAIAVEIMPAPRHSKTFEGIMERGSLDLIVAIDFTKKNGNGITPGTSHFRGVGLNDYQWVANTLGATFGSFSKSHEIPVYGFGGQYQGRDYDLFQCGTQPKVRGVSGLLEAYDYVFSTGIVFGDRCNYDNVIMAAAYESQKQLDLALQQGKISYSVLLVLTTGTETDVLAAKEKLGVASKCPLSVLFIRIQNSERLSFGDTKIRNYLQNQYHRSSCHCIDSILFSASRNSQALSVACLEKVKIDLLQFFNSSTML